MTITKTITANGSKGHHKFNLRVSEDNTSDNSSFMGFSFILAPIQTGWDWNWSGQPEKISYEIKFTEEVVNLETNEVETNEFYKTTGTIPVYNGSSTVTVKSASNIEIPHNSDGTKTIDISFKVTDTTGTSYTCGNASASGSMELSQLHQAPEITGVSLVENNSVLTNLSVDSSTIVQYLSNKKFTVTATYDDAEIDNCSIYHNNVLIGTSDTNEVTVDFSTVSELITTETNDTHYVGLTVAVTDSKSGYSTRIFNFPVIKYTRPTIESTSTTIKRKTSGGALLTANIAVLNFVGTCYKGDDVIGNANKPTVQYKVWKETEPDYSDLTVENVSSVKIENFEISNLIYTNTYNYKIKINDVFTNSTTEPIEKIGVVPTGVSVWTEYKDRVDYLAITRQGKQVYSNIYSYDEVVIGIYNDKPLYRKVIDFGALNSEKGTKEVAHNITNIETITDIKIIGFESEFAFPIPFVGTTYMFAGIDYTARVDKTNIYIYVSGDRSTQTAEVTLEYTKTSD